MRIYVLNATGQKIIFNYRFDFLVDDQGHRMPGTAKPYRSLDIPPRTQIQLGGDWNIVQGQELIRQLEEPAVGGHHVGAIKTAKAKGVVRVVWSQDKIIPRAICDDVYSHNVDFLAGDGERRRKQMAIANSITTDNAIGEVSTGFAVEVETVEESAESASPSLNRGYRVRKDVPKAPPVKRRARA